MQKSLEQIRLNKNLSQKEVANIAQISRAFYTHIENGRRTPSIGVAKRIALALGISLDEFFNAMEVTKCNSFKE